MATPPLLRNDSWSNDALGVSDCVNAAVATYLETAQLPNNLSCTTDDAPFAYPLPSIGGQEAVDRSHFGAQNVAQIVADARRGGMRTDE